ncbi:MAG TPA: A24 family peptidase [Lacipirellulaceae bacterium]|jgi:prepilin signal peptidase PulO-like enzyme (type II secretory pathway)
MTPIALVLAAMFAVGTCLGSLVNWAIYSLAWNWRSISPWSPSPDGARLRDWLDRLPMVGWLRLRREAVIHGRGFWIRPLLLEVCTGAAVAALYWWEVDQLGLVRGQSAAAISPPLGPLYWQFAGHVLLLCWMLAASLIDIDEQLIPDEITVTGTLLGLALATLVPMSLLPQVAERAESPVVGAALQAVGSGQALGPNGSPLWLEPVTAVAPNAWPPDWGVPGYWRSLVMALGCYWLWCFALAPRIWRGRRGPTVALRLIAARLNRELSRPPLRRFLLAGTFVIVLVWAVAAQGWWHGAQLAWAGLLTALVGLVGSGCIVWAVRLIGTAALRREAMGFGDVTLMMMIGTFLGWQACIVVFFLSPFAALVVGLLQFILRRDDVIPFGPFLCLAAAAVAVYWAEIWNRASPIFAMGWLVPAALGVCLILLGVILAVWRKIKSMLFGESDGPAD